MGERWELQYLGRRINPDLFEQWMDPYQTNYYHCILNNYQLGNSEVRVELYVYYNDEGCVDSIDLTRTKYSEFGAVEVYDPSKRDQSDAAFLLNEVMPLRGTNTIIPLVDIAIQNRASSNNFRPMKVNKQSITFSAPNQTTKQLRIRDLAQAYDLVFTYPDICKNRNMLNEFSFLFGEKNLDMVYTILNSVEAPEKLKEEYEQSLSGLARPTSPKINKLQVDPALEIETDEEHLAVLTKWVEKNEEICVPELLYASDKYEGYFDDTIIRLALERLGELESEVESWASHVTALIYAFRKANSVNVRIESLKYIHGFAKSHSPNNFWFVPNLYHKLTEELSEEINEISNRV